MAAGRINARGAPRKRAASGRVPAKCGRTGTEEIYDCILTAIVEQRLHPGTKLGEDRLGEIFGVSRARVRPVLARLAHEKLVTTLPNRGAFVARPTIVEAREIFDMRRLIEPGMVQRCIATSDAKKIALLRKHVAAEGRARAANDRRLIVRLSGEFHMLLAEMAGNGLLAKTMRELTRLTCLIIFLYDTPAVPACPYREHDEIVDAIEAGDEGRAAATMLRHLHHVEGSLDLRIDFPETPDLAAVLA